MPPCWRIELLGCLRAARAGEVVSRFRTEKTGGLLGWLAFERDRSHPRELLLELIWPSLEPDAGRAALSQALWSLRKELEPPGVPRGSVILATRASIQLAPEAVATDVADFRAALAAPAAAGRTQALERAVALYRGELLPGHFEDWVLAERTRLREAFLAAAHELVAGRLHAGDPAAARDLARRAAAADPLSEPARRDLMRVLAALGDRAAAARELRELEGLLARELGVPPSAETRALAREIERGPAAAPPRPPASREPPRPRLPLELGRFFGREEELAYAMEALSCDVRLLTVRGPGGIGKTRFAAEVAARLAERFEGAAFFAALADVREGARVADAIADALGLPPGPEDPLERIAAALAGRPRSLLVLDNLEQVVAAGASIVRALLERVPGLACLVTSRRSLGLEGERELPLSPLPTPAGALAPERLLELASARLFVDRARAVRPDFQVTASNAAEIAAILRRLEGIPLALALAAARAQLLTPAQMLLRLDSRLDLASRRRDTPARHRTLGAAIEWSHALLAPELQRVFASLSVFEGGFTLDAAEAVLELPGAIDRLADLGECSLLEPPSAGARPRWRMLETIREFAARSLEPEDRRALERRHAEFFASLPRKRGTPARYPPPEVLAPDLENFRAALAWGLREPGGADLALGIAASLFPFWSVRAHFEEALRWLSALLERSAARTADRAGALNAVGVIFRRRGEPAKAREALEQAQAVFRELGDPDSAGIVAGNLGLLAVAAGDDARARAAFEEAVAAARASGKRRNLAPPLCNLGLIECLRGRYDAARERFEEGLAIAREMGEPSDEIRRNLARIALVRGEHARARAMADELVAEARAIESEPKLADALVLRGDIDEEEGNPAAAARFEEALALARRHGLRDDEAEALAGLAGAAAARGELSRALRLADEALEACLAAEGPSEAGFVQKRRAEVLRASGDLAGARKAYLQAIADRVAERRREYDAPCVEGLAAIARAEGDVPGAARLLGAAAAMREALGTPVAPRDRKALEAERGLLREALGDRALEDALAAGRALAWSAELLASKRASEDGG
jgi:predicted ATPase/DNA-binding SARP family transcriptional activator